ncbi:MAG TPA: hypothetical protein VLC71_13985 [Thermomonas sp.]|nr:hypothetical protein [Thermomonas sp.]
MHDRTIAAALACMLAIGLPVSTFAASPEREAAGWKHWADFSANIVAHVGEVHCDAAGAEAAGKGVTGMTISQGFQFPYWDRA